MGHWTQGHVPVQLHRRHAELSRVPCWSCGKRWWSLAPGASCCFGLVGPGGQGPARKGDSPCLRVVAWLWCCCLSAHSPRPASSLTPRRLLLPPLHPALHRPGRQDRCSAECMWSCTRHLCSRLPTSLCVRSRPRTSVVAVCSGLLVFLKVCSPCPGLLLPFPSVIVCYPISVSEPGAGSCAASWPPLLLAEPGASGRGVCRAGFSPQGSACGRPPCPLELRAVSGGVGQAGALRRLQSWEGAFWPLWARDGGIHRMEACPRPQPQPLSSPVSRADRVGT